jgi:hypothetical protein
MKTLLLTAILSITAFISSFAEPPAIVNADVIADFKANYKDATNVGWVVHRDYLKAQFDLNDQKMEVFYNQRGNIIATAKIIDLEQLPIFAKRAFAKHYSDYTVKQVIHMETDEEGCYYFAAENDKRTLIFKVSDIDQLSIFKTIKK